MRNINRILLAIILTVSPLIGLGAMGSQEVTRDKVQGRYIGWTGPDHRGTRISLELFPDNSAIYMEDNLSAKTPDQAIGWWELKSSTLSINSLKTFTKGNLNPSEMIFSVESVGDRGIRLKNQSVTLLLVPDNQLIDTTWVWEGDSLDVLMEVISQQRPNSAKGTEDYKLVFKTTIGSWEGQLSLQNGKIALNVAVPPLAPKNEELTSLVMALQKCETYRIQGFKLDFRSKDLDDGKEGVVFRRL